MRSTASMGTIARSTRNTLADVCTTIVRDEHRRLRDLLLELRAAIVRHDRDRAGRSLQRLASAMGPHLRYEEEAVFPVLVASFGWDCRTALLAGHDRIIDGLRRLDDLLRLGEKHRVDFDEALVLLCGLLAPLTDCDGMTLWIERLEKRQVRKILDCREEALRAGHDVFLWASSYRPREPVLEAQR